LLKLGQFMAGLGAKESHNDYQLVSKISGAFGKYQTLPASWEKWSVQFFGTVVDWHDEKNQERIVGWKLQQRLAWFRAGFPEESSVRIFQRLAAWWLSPAISDADDPVTEWSAHLKDYVLDIGAILNKKGYEGWTEIATS